ncbi:MAG: M15 family metallopeptidase [Pseudomonadota bacterium]|nr:M15 family metallopeptidase [Pseudomonadota bacterium]
MPALMLLLALAGAAPADPLPLVDAASVVPGLQVELKYSTTDNFLGRDVYGDLAVCRLQAEAAEMLRAASEALRGARPDLRLRAYDCARPHSVQVAMWAIVEGTPQQGYVADPTSAVGSIHNYGCAIDLTVATAAGVPLDMGTPFDFFGNAAQPRHERAHLLDRILTGAQVANRLVLREAMVRAGFLPLEHEWWHFDCASGTEARRRYAKIP